MILVGAILVIGLRVVVRVILVVWVGVGEISFRVTILVEEGVEIRSILVIIWGVWVGIISLVALGVGIAAIFVWIYWYIGYK